MSGGGVNDIVAANGELLRSILGERIEIEALLADSLWSVDVDPLQLKAALINLCVTARDAMLHGGTLRIETRNVSLGADYVTLNPGASPGDHVLLAVTDSSTSRASDDRPGGGLDTVARFLNQCGGHLKRYSVDGHGTTARLYFRRAENQAAPPPSRSVPGGRERILVVDDDDDVRKGIVDQLESLGYTVSAAADSREGLERLKLGPAFDLLISDVVMPWPMNGKGLADEVEKRWPRLPVLFMSGYTENAILNHGLLAESVQFIAKPFRKVDLAQAIRKVLDE